MRDRQLEADKDLARRFVTAFDGRDLAAIDHSGFGLAARPVSPRAAP